MPNLFKQLFKKQEDLKSIYLRGAVIIDVRTVGEFNEGHIPGAINVPLDRLKASVHEVKKLERPIITCCLSGGRSGAALDVLSKAGIETYNGGSWRSLERIIQ